MSKKKIITAILLTMTFGLASTTLAQAPEETIRTGETIVSNRDKDSSGMIGLIGLLGGIGLLGLKGRAPEEPGMRRNVPLGSH
ncbi:MAG: hypothetical protein KF773_06115 [Deltaproteobacteria bacterium]|nr:hypothetical protein [Deltaproteobacteria bacterium]MCW5807199.1 hypothetical protein [Deltaproteobacteria bacterium]